jgi:hypothetical protein
MLAEIFADSWKLFLLVVVWQLVCYLITWGLSRVGDAVTRAPLLDLVCSLFSWVPWVLCFAQGSWRALGLCLVAQFVSIEIFSLTHTWLHGYRGPKIRHALDEVVGPLRNHTGLMVTLMIVPIVWMIRLGQVTVYPLQVLGLGFPWYRHADWVSVNRQKFRGLVGHDLVWCLYCEWVLSIYSLGAEMIRNNESWWCPIQFHDADKCARCVTDFPAIPKWVNPEGSMQDVKDNLRARYCPKKRPRGWEGFRR